MFLESSHPESAYADEGSPRIMQVVPVRMCTVGNRTFLSPSLVETAAGWKPAELSHFHTFILLSPSLQHINLLHAPCSMQ